MLASPNRSLLGVVAVRRITATFALALFVLGCSAQNGEPVKLLTGGTACYLGGEHPIEGRLTTDPEYGTRFNGKAVIWPVGFTGVRLADGEVAVLNQAGKTIATTGKEYGIAMASAGDGVEGYPAAVNCGFPQDFYEVNWFPLLLVRVLGVAALVFGMWRVWTRLRPAGVPSSGDTERSSSAATSCPGDR